MSEGFDPYQEWLGIPKVEQPPNYYRLLNLRLFEDIPSLIQTAVSEQTQLLKKYQLSKHVAECQDVLNQVAAASVCLLDPQKKIAYDTKLRIELGLAGKPGKPKNTGLHPLAMRGAKQTDFALGRGGELAVKVGLTFASLALSSVFIVLMLGWFKSTPQNAVLAFEWPEEERQGATLRVNGQPATLPLAGRYKHETRPGQYRVVATRPGYKPFEQTLLVEAGETATIRPVWQLNGNDAPPPEAAGEPVESETPEQSVVESDTSPAAPAATTPEPSPDGLATTSGPGAAPAVVPEPKPVATQPQYSGRQQPNPPETSPGNPLLAAQLSVVSIMMAGDGAPGQPAVGFIVDDGGVIATSFVAVAGATTGQVVFCDRPPVQIAGYIAADKGMDLVLLKLNISGLPALPFSQSLPTAGDPVVALQFGANREGMRGIARALRPGEQVQGFLRAVPGAGAETLTNLAPQSTWLQTSLSITRQQRGTPLVNLQGQVLGMCVWTGTNGTGSSFALHAQEIQELLDSAGNDYHPLSELTAEKPKPVVTTEKPKPDGTIAQITLGSGKVFRPSDFATDMDSAVALVEAWAKEDATVVQVKHGSLFSTGYVRHNKGEMNGVAVLFYDEETPKEIVTYVNNQRHGLLKLWDKEGHDLYWSHWANGKRDGISCLFHNDQPWLVTDSTEDEYTSLALVLPSNEVKQFASSEEAAEDTSASKALEAVTQIENDIKSVHYSLARNVRDEAGRELEERRRMVASRLSVQARRRATARINQRGSQAGAALGALWRKAGGAR